jgi:hypothetical protein
VLGTRIPETVMRRIFIAALIGLTAAISLSGPVAAQTKTATKPVTTKPIDQGTKPSAGPALTSAECKAIGGTASVALACEGGNGCFAADQNGTVHLSCIDEVRH